MPRTTSRTEVGPEELQCRYRSRFIRFSSAIAITVLPWVNVTQSFAQTAASAAATAGQAAQAGPDESAAGEINEIVVTANKRLQSLQDVPLTVAVIGAAQLAEQRISTLADIAQAVPGLTFSPSENNTPVYTLRGVGFNDASLSAYPTVSVYLDEAPLAFPVLASQGAFDLDRIEVLKGPQGTLFGQNSTGGAINYIAAKPTNTFSSGIDASFSRFNTVELNGYASGPLTDTLAIRISGSYIHADDWQYDYTRDDSLGKRNVAQGRIILQWTPTDQLRFSLNLNGWYDGSDPEAGQLVAVNVQIPFPNQNSLLNYPFAPNNARAADWTPNGIVTPIGQAIDFRPTSDRRFGQAFLRTDYDLSPTITLTGLTSGILFQQWQATDYDGIALNDTDLPVNDGSIRTVYQEIRLSNGSNGGFRWTLGTNYQASRVIEDDNIRYQNDSQVIPSLDDIIGNGFRSTTDRYDSAGFASGEFDATNQLTFLAGARFTNNETKASICNYDLGDGRVNALFTTLGSELSGTTVAPLKPGQCFSLNYNFIPGEPYIDTLKQNNVSWRGGVQFRFTPDVMAYANASRGYKAGSFPTISSSSWKQYAPVTQESVSAFEIGTKGNLLNRKLDFNAAAFYYKYGDKQILGKELDPTFGVLNALINVPRSRIYGTEFELDAHPFRDLTLSASGTYLSSRVTDYIGTNVVGGTENFAGDRLPFTPTWQGMIGAEWRRHAGGDWQPFVGFNIDGRSWTQSYILPDNFALPTSPLVRVGPGIGNPFFIKGYATTDLRAGVSSADSKWKVMIYGKNIFNNYHWTNVISGFDTIYREAAAPATYGITLFHKFSP
jgi:iron complex outermembrane receptor protein